MTSRRSFFRQLALSVAAISSAQILVPVARDAYKWKRTGKWLYVVNPEYLDAPYEVAGVAWNDPTEMVFCDRVCQSHNGIFRIPENYYPFRYADAAAVVSIPPFIKKFVNEPYYSL